MDLKLFCFIHIRFGKKLSRGFEHIHDIMSFIEKEILISYNYLPKIVSIDSFNEYTIIKNILIFYKKEIDRYVTIL